MITREEIGRILTAKGPIDLSSIPTTHRWNGWYIGGGRLRWHTPNDEKGIELLNIHDKNPPLLELDILLRENRRNTDSLDKRWVLARLAELSFVLPPEMTKAEIKAEIDKRGKIKRIPRDGLDRTPVEEWYQSGDQVKYQEYEGSNIVKAFWIRLPLTKSGDITFIKNRMAVNTVDTVWALARLDELSFTAAPPGVPGVTIAVDKTTCGMNEQIRLTGTYTGEDGRILVGHDLGFHGYLKGTKKYLGKTKTTSGGQYSFTYALTDEGTWQFTAYNDYTSPKVTVTVTPPVTAQSALSPEMCRWIKSLMTKGLTEDHGRYVYQLAKGRVALAAHVLAIMRITPFILPTIKVTEDMGRALYQYAKGRKSLGNKITGCNF